MLCWFDVVAVRWLSLVLCWFDVVAVRWLSLVLCWFDVVAEPGLFVFEADLDSLESYIK